MELADKKYPYAFFELGYMTYFEDFGIFNEQTAQFFLQAAESNIKDAYYYAGMSYYHLVKPIEAEKYLLMALKDERYGQLEKVETYYQLAQNYRFWDEVTPKYLKSVKFYSILKTLISAFSVLI